MIIESKRPFLFRPATTHFRRLFFLRKTLTTWIPWIITESTLSVMTKVPRYISHKLTYKRLLMSQSALNFKLLQGTLKNLTSNNHKEGQKNRCAPGFRCLVASNKQCTCLTFAFNHTTTCIRKALGNRTADLTRASSCSCRFEEDPQLALLLWNAL